MGIIPGQQRIVKLSQIEAVAALPQQTVDLEFTHLIARDRSLRFRMVWSETRGQPKARLRRYARPGLRVFVRSFSFGAFQPLELQAYPEPQGPGKYQTPGNSESGRADANVIHEVDRAVVQQVPDVGDHPEESFPAQRDPLFGAEVERCRASKFSSPGGKPFTSILLSTTMSGIVA